MLIIALVLAAIGLAALVFAVVTSNALVAWVCIGASLLGVLLLIADALRERRANQVAASGESGRTTEDSESSDAAADGDAVEVAESEQVFVENYDTYATVDPEAAESSDVLTLEHGETVDDEPLANAALADAATGDDATGDDATGDDAAADADGADPAQDRTD